MILSTKYLCALIASFFLLNSKTSGQIFLKYQPEMKVIDDNVLKSKAMTSGDLFKKVNILYVLPMKNPNYKQNYDRLLKHIKANIYPSVNSIIVLQDATDQRLNQITKQKSECLTIVADSAWLASNQLYINDHTKMYGFLYDRSGEVKYLGYFLQSNTIPAIQKRVSKMLNE